MRKDALFDRYELFVAAGVLAAHSNHLPHEGFRQRDVKFLIELFSNWVEYALLSPTLELQNTQVLRYLESIVQEGYARRFLRKGRPLYQLTRTGLIELTTRIVSHEHLLPAAHFLFIHYFIANYRPRIIHLVKEQGKQFPTALRLELDSLLDTTALIKQQLELAKREAQTLISRAEDSRNTSKLAIELFRKKCDVKEVVEKVEKLYPYELNSQKPLSELFANLTPDWARWELETGSLRRAEQIWDPSLMILKQYIDILSKY